VSLTLETAEVPEEFVRDEIPETMADGVGTEAPYGYTKSGRIRKRPLGQRGSFTNSDNPAKVQKLADQATSVIMEHRDMLTFGVSVAGLTDTAELLSDREDKFRAKIHTAFLLDSKLAQQIIDMGGSSGKIIFLSAIVLELGSVGTSAYFEWQNSRRED
jgi:hypothetical protein